MKKRNNAIGLIDSGIGGLTILNELIKQLPNESYLYIADQKYCPYSNLSIVFLKQRLLRICEYLEKRRVKLIIIACNTGSIFIDYLRKYIKTPIVSVIIPTCKEVIKKTKNRNVGLLATKTTIDSKIYEDILKKENIKSYGVSCSEFVKIIENENIDSYNSKLIINNKINQLTDKNIDTLVYGCTHFSLLHKVIQPYFKNCTFIDSSKPTSNFVFLYLISLDLIRNKKKKVKIVIKTTLNKRKTKKQISIFKIKNIKLSKIKIKML